MKGIHIGIDARFWGLKHAGLGRYVMELVTALSQLDRENRYTLFVLRPYEGSLKLPANFRLVGANIRHYSPEEQWLLPEVFSRAGMDLLHVPHFNVPLRYSKPFVVTIHDLLWHEVKGLSVTTQNPLAYLVKYLGYRVVVGHALKTSNKIFVPSKFIKEKLVVNHGVDAKKVSVTYEAPSRVYIPHEKDQAVLRRYGLTAPFVIYTGSAYPHKNISAAARAVKRVNADGGNLSLAIASSRSVFLDRLDRELRQQGTRTSVHFLGFVPDEDLALLYACGLALVQPSMSEGFGLTGLEAMASGLPVLASDAPVFREVYGEAALYFDPGNEEDLAQKMRDVLRDAKMRDSLARKGLSQVKKYSWKTLAIQTLNEYVNAVKT